MNVVTASDKPAYELSQTGLLFSEDITYDEWAQCGKELANVYSKLQYAVGDWLNFGERKFGEMYNQAIDDTHFSYGTLRNYSSICARIPLENRNPKLKFHQIKHVACLEPHEQRAIIAAAVKHDMTGDDILEAVQRVQGKQPKTHESAEGTINSHITVSGLPAIVILVNEDDMEWLKTIDRVTIKAK